MTLIVETGEGVHEANAYHDLAFAQAYLTARGRWNDDVPPVTDADIIAAADYIEKRFGSRFPGTRTVLEATYATARIVFEAVPVENNHLVLGDMTYTFKDVSSELNDVMIVAGDLVMTLANLIMAIETSENPAISAVTVLTGQPTTLQATSAVLGRMGNATHIGGDLQGTTLPTFMGGYNAGPARLSFPRVDGYDREGFKLEGVPFILMEASVEYAVRARENPLLPNVSTSGGVLRRRERVGPIEEDIQYSAPSSSVQQAYPAADELLRPLLLRTGGRVIRA